MPFKEPDANSWEICNEVFIALTLYLLFGVTDVTDDPNDRDIVGWWMVFVTCITLVIIFFRAGGRSYLETYRMIRLKLLKTIFKVKTQKLRRAVKERVRVKRDEIGTKTERFAKSSDLSSEEIAEVSVRQQASDDSIVEIR